MGWCWCSLCSLQSRGSVGHDQVNAVGNKAVDDGAQLAESPCAFCKSKVTFSPKEAVRASLKPWVAASRASCCTSWQMPPMQQTLLQLLPQAARETV